MTVVDVTKFGAVGDGVANDTLAITRAAASARKLSTAPGTRFGHRGVTLAFPAGQYVVDSSLNFDATHGIRLVGEGTTGGAGSTETASLRFVQPAGPDECLISAFGSDNFQIEHLDIQYDEPGMLGALVAVDGTAGRTDRQGGVEVTNGSTALKLIDAKPLIDPKPWAYDPAPRRLIVAGTAEVFSVTLIDEGRLDQKTWSGALDRPFTGPSQPAASYWLMSETGHHGYDEGTLDVEAGKDRVTLSGGIWIPTAPRMRSVSIGSSVYRITVDSATTGMLDGPYLGSSNPAITYNLFAGSDTKDPVFRNVHLGGAPRADGTSRAAALLVLNMSIGAVVDKCGFDYAEAGIVGRRSGGWGSNPVTVANSTFMRIGSGAGILDPGGTWLVESCTFEPAYYYDKGPVGILTSPDGGSWGLTVNNCWFGDGGGTDLRPWIRFAGFVLNVTNNFFASAGPNRPLVEIVGTMGTVHNVNVSGNYLAPDPTAPAVQVSADAVVESMTLIGNWRRSGTGLVRRDGTVQGLAIIESDGRTDFRTGLHEYGRDLKSGTHRNYPLADTAPTADPGTPWNLVDGTIGFAYQGLVLTLWFDTRSTISAPSGSLSIALPEGSFALGASAGTSTFSEDANGVVWQLGEARTDGARLIFTRVDGLQWPAGVTLRIRGTFIIPLDPNANINIE